MYTPIYNVLSAGSIVLFSVVYMHGIIFYFTFYLIILRSFVCSFGSYRFLSEEKNSTLEFFTIYQPTFDIFLYQQSYR